MLKTVLIVFLLAAGARAFSGLPEIRSSEGSQTTGERPELPDKPDDSSPDILSDSRPEKGEAPEPILSENRQPSYERPGIEGLSVQRQDYTGRRDMELQTSDSSDSADTVSYRSACGSENTKD